MPCGIHTCGGTPSSLLSHPPVCVPGPELVAMIVYHTSRLSRARAFAFAPDGFARTHAHYLYAHATHACAYDVHAFGVPPTPRFTDTHAPASTAAAAAAAARISVSAASVESSCQRAYCVNRQHALRTGSRTRVCHGRQSGQRVHNETHTHTHARTQST